VQGEEKRAGKHTELELARPHGPRRVLDQIACEIALHAANHVVAARLAALADDTEGVVLHDGCTADSTEEALLHAALELEDRDLGGGLVSC